MRILAFDTTGPVLSVGSAADGKPLSRCNHPAERGKGNLLELSIDEVLSETGWTRHDVEGLALLTGPGSLTAMRIGWAAAVGWAQAAGIPIAGWSVPGAHRRFWRNKAADVACCVHYRGDVFLLYALGVSHDSPVAVQLDGTPRIRNSPHILTGPGVLGYRDRWSACFGPTTRIMDDSEAVIGADQLALWGEIDLRAGNRLEFRESLLEYGLPPDFKKLPLT